MTFHLPWLAFLLLLPLVGGLVLGQLRDVQMARRWCVALTGLTFLFGLAAWQDYSLLGQTTLSDPYGPLTYLPDQWTFALDELSAPLVPVTALVFFLTALATTRTKMARFSFAWMLISEGVVLATFCSLHAWQIVLLLAIAAIPPWVEIRDRRRPTRVYLLHMLLFMVLMAAGQWLITREGEGQLHSSWGVLALLVAMLIRSGVFPFHCWLTDLFEQATFGTALLYVTPITGAYGVVRLVLPVAEASGWEGLLHGMGILSLGTAIYAGGMSLVQTEIRRFFCFLFLTQSALVLAGLELDNAISLTGSLSMWLALSISLVGFGLTLRALEARYGRMDLRRYLGLYDASPLLAICFALCGLAIIGFPGTVGFVGTDLLVDGAVEESPRLGIAVAVATALTGIAFVRVYLLLFTGTRHHSTIFLRVGNRERIAIFTLAALVLGGGFYPQPGIASRHHAALDILKSRPPRSEARQELFEEPSAADEAVDQQASDSPADDHLLRIVRTSADTFLVNGALFSQEKLLSWLDQPEWDEFAAVVFSPGEAPQKSLDEPIIESLRAACERLKKPLFEELAVGTRTGAPLMEVLYSPVESQAAN